MVLHAHSVQRPDSPATHFSGATRSTPPPGRSRIGHTWFGRQWWGSGHNAASKLLLLTYAFETLGAVRVAWHTDIKNERSQAAIEKLGAQREGVWRKHRLRRDGTWRDTVQYAMTDDEWPAAAARLRIRSGC